MHALLHASFASPSYPKRCPAVQVAIKKVLQDKRFKNRELQIMKMMGHPNVVDLKHCFYTNTDKDEVRRLFAAVNILMGCLQQPYGIVIF